MNNHQIIDQLKSVASAHKAKSSMRFFKTAPGQYGHGDKFLGVTVPQIRKIAKTCQYIDITELQKLLKSDWHEVRLLALIILVTKYQKAKFHAEKQQLVDFYVNNLDYVNNWDLVDSSAHYILGAFVYQHRGYYSALKTLAHSDDLWRRRVAMISTFYFIKQGSNKECFEIADILLDDDHDLIHKAVGWMLRESGKNVSEAELKQYLDARYKTMPRTMLRYAIERLSKTDQKHYLKT